MMKRLHRFKTSFKLPPALYVAMNVEMGVAMNVAMNVAFGVVLAGALSACASGPSSAPAAKPKLVVLLVIDGLPQRQVLDYRDQLAPDGFARFLDRGAWFANGHYGYSFTVTGAGHATLLSGAYPDRTGIIGNDWRDPATGEPEYCAGDTSATYIGHKTQPLDGTSPKNLRAETVGDVLKRLNPKSKVIAISGKDRGAILPAGKTGTAYMYMGATGQFASSTFYMKEHPTWVNTFNTAKPADRYFKKSWTALLPEAAYARSIPDQQTWFGPRGGGLPMVMGVAADEAPGPGYYSGLLVSPFADALTLEFARAAIAGEGLGQGDTPDILSVSLSGHDYVNHRFSAESRLSHDHFLHLDRMIQSFFTDLDATVGKDKYVAVLSADHGFMPAPEHTASLGQASGRVNLGQLMGTVNQALEARFGAGKWVLGNSASAVLIDKKLIAQKGGDSAALANALAEETRTVLLANPGIAAAYTRREFETNSRAGAAFFDPMRKSWHPQVSGDVQYVFKANWMVAVPGLTATHGSPHPYDTNVPMLWYGPRWIAPGRVDTRVEVADIAPTLSGILGVAAPSSSVGKVLPLPTR